PPRGCRPAHQVRLMTDERNDYALTREPADAHSVGHDAGPLVQSESKSQGQIIWEQFRKHKSALVGGVILILMYLTAVFAGFLAPYGINEYRRTPVAAFRAPTPVHWTDPDTGR